MILRRVANAFRQQDWRTRVGPECALGSDLSKRLLQVGLSSNQALFACLEVDF
jgi:hypothetical protein